MDAVADQKQAATALRHTEVGCVQYMLFQEVAKTAEAEFQFAVARPRGPCG